jgi:hypothetical protein
MQLTVPPKTGVRSGSSAAIVPGLVGPAAVFGVGRSPDQAGMLSHPMQILPVPPVASSRRPAAQAVGGLPGQSGGPSPVRPGQGPSPRSMASPAGPSRGPSIRIRQSQGCDRVAFLSFGGLQSGDAMLALPMRADGLGYQFTETVRTDRIKLDASVAMFSNELP